MNDSLYSKKVDAGTSRCDINGSWMLSSVLEAMQDTANEHCKFLHVGHDDLALKNLTWVLFKVDLRIVRYPKLGEQVTVKTLTKRSNFKFFPRYYTIEDETGSQICKAGALWMLKDKESRSAMTSRESGIELPNAKDIVTPIRISTKSKDVDGEVFVYPYTALYLLQARGVRSLRGR